MVAGRGRVAWSCSPVGSRGRWGWGKAYGVVGEVQAEFGRQAGRQGEGWYGQKGGVRIP